MSTPMGQSWPANIAYNFVLTCYGALSQGLSLMWLFYCMLGDTLFKAIFL